MPPRLARLLAILAALALVIGAFVLRGALAGDDDAGGEETAATGDGPSPGGGSYRVACDEDLGDAACEAIGDLAGVRSVEILAATEAVAAMAGDDVPYDAWVTLDPWPAILDVERSEATEEPIVSGEPVPVASSGVALLTYETRGIECPDPATWGCLVEQAPTVGIGVPALDTAAGTLILGHAADGLIDRSDFGYADIVDTDVAGQLQDLLDSGVPRPTAAQARTSLQPGNYRAVVTVAGLARRLAASPQGKRSGAVVTALDPAATIGVVLAPIGRNGEAAVERLKGGVTGQTVSRALDEAGWTGKAKASAGLPAFDVLYRLKGFDS